MPEQPNILLIMDDQHRWDWLGCAGADWVRTPNIDKLAARGVRFTTCCTNAPVCAPARIGLASGLQPARLGARDNHAFLPFSTPTYYQRLRNAGYHVAGVGKFDLGKPDPYNGLEGNRPASYGWGFTHPIECEGKMHAGKSTGEKVKGPYTRFLHERGLLDTFVDDYAHRAKVGWSIACDDSPLPADAFEDAYVGRRAVRFIDEHPGDFPFHLFVSFLGPHDPFDPPTEYAEHFRNAEMPEPLPASFDDKPAWTRNRHVTDDPELIRKTRRQYAAAIELIDDQVGDIIAALERKGVLDNTIILFASDHGEMLGDHGMYTKSVPYEPALRVPLIAAGPGIQQGPVSDALVELIDVNATICDLAGLPPQPDIDARSFAPILRGETEKHRQDCISSVAGFALIRTERYKFVAHEHDRNELYDLREDPAEQRNLIDEQPDLAGKLHRRMRERFIEDKWNR